jgi:y4mF family transcriptional regulator
MTTEELGGIIRNARLNLGLRQDQLAAAAGVGVRFLIELERGKPTAQLGKTLAVLHALGFRIEITTPPSLPGETS